VLRCRSDHPSFGSAAIAWNRQVDGVTNELIANGCRFGSGTNYSSAYSLITDNMGRCDLRVNSTTAFLTGKYTCSEPSVQTADANLTAIGK